MSALSFLIVKEFKQFFRNALLPKMALSYPIIVMLVMPLVTTMDVRNISVTVVDSDNSSTSTRLVDKIKASEYFKFNGVSLTYDAALIEVEDGSADVVLEIPRDYERDFLLQKSPTLHISANAVSGTKGSLGGSYINSIIMEFSQMEFEQARGVGVKPPINIDVVNMYNPTLTYRNYMIPALMVMIFIVLCAVLPALNIVSEKEIGTIEQMNATPVTKTIFILSKLIPYWIMGVVVFSLCFVLSWFAYDLLPVGSFGAIYVASVIFILVMSGFGLILSNYSSTMQQALFVAFFFIMIFMLMSGLFTPIKSMPDWAQWVSAFNPPRYFIDILRAVYLKGSGMADLWQKYVALGVFAVVFNIMAVVSYRKRS